jgi:hypothetical protein
MSNTLSIGFQWLSRDYGSEIDRATFADIAIAADGYVATEMEDLRANTIRQTARLSAYELAQWFAFNWWRLLWEPKKDTLSWKMSHKMGAVGGGYLWPDLSFESDGVFVTAQSHATSRVKDQPVRYLNNFSKAFSVKEFEMSVGEFIEAVIVRVATETAKETELAKLWKEVLEERNNPFMVHWRKLEAILGFDPGEAPDELIKVLQKDEKLYGASAIAELAALSMADAPTIISELWNNARLHSTRLNIPTTLTLRTKIHHTIKPSEVAWKQAETAAKIVRDSWDLGKGPLITKRLCDVLSVPEELILRSDDVDTPISAGFRDGNIDQLNVCLKKSRPVNRRFALARLIGDHVTSGDAEKLLPATAIETWRQKFQRAFAQEFLCPFDELENYLGDKQLSDELLDEAAAYFEVSPLVIRTTLVNKGSLDRTVLTC